MMEIIVKGEVRPRGACPACFGAGGVANNENGALAGRKIDGNLQRFRTCLRCDGTKQECDYIRRIESLFPGEDLYVEPLRVAAA